MISSEPPQIGAFTNAEITASNQRHDARYGYEMGTWTYSNPFRLAGHEPVPPNYAELKRLLRDDAAGEIWKWHRGIQKTNAC